MNRAPREDDNRSENEREYSWKPASTLPDPMKMDGWRFKWVRKMSLGETDVMNMSKRRREGWEFVTHTEQPDLAVNSDSTTHIEYGGLVLCKAPEGLMRKRDEYYAGKAKAQQDGLSSDFRSAAREDSRMPLIEERATKVSDKPDR